MCENCGCSAKAPVEDPKEPQTLEVLQNLLEKNDRQAEENKRHFTQENVYSVNLMSSPGSGKTSLIEKTIEWMNGQKRIGVIEGDLETNKDVERILAKGVPAFQITTGQTCHLDAQMVHRGIHHLPLQELDIVFVENVGNLVCPASYDLGTHLNVVLLSVTEGDDKPAKYPVIFRRADLLLITKIDLIEHLDFKMETAIEEAKKINPKLEVIALSSRTGEGIQAWIDQLNRRTSLGARVGRG